MSLTEPYKIVVVEDEPPILHNVVHKIEALELPLHVVGTAMDGQTALELIRRERPHIVITDIRMPGMDGLELCRILSQELPGIKTVVLSGYSDFEYARTAIRYQVSEYLLKPVNVVKLRETLEGLCEALEDRLRSSRRKHLELQLSGSMDGHEVPFQFEGESFGLCLVCLGSLQDNDDRPGDVERTRMLWQRAAIDSFLDGEQLSCWWLVEEKNPNERMLLTVGGNTDLTARLFSRLCEEFAGDCSVNLCRCDVPVVFSEIWNTARQLRTTLRRCLVPCRSAVFSQHDRGSPDGGGVRSTLLQAIRDGSPSQFRGLLHTFLLELRENGTTQVKLEAEVKELLYAIFKQHQDDGSASGRYQNCGQAVVDAVDENVLYSCLEEQLYAAFAEHAANTLSAERLALTVKKYLDENYQQEVTVEDLARRFHFSGSYITRLFRNQFGTPPVKYLLGLRIQRAKELIAASPEISFGTVAGMVGYQDQHYFSRLFRISTGMSPSEYKDSIK